MTKISQSFILVLHCKYFNFMLKIALFEFYFVREIFEVSFFLFIIVMIMYIKVFKIL